MPWHWPRLLRPRTFEPSAAPVDGLRAGQEIACDEPRPGGDGTQRSEDGVSTRGSMGQPQAPQDIVDVIRHRVLAGLHLGLFRAGARLPSARELGRDLGAHQRAVMAAYRALERDGVVEVRARSGVYVAPTALSPGWLLPQFQEWVVDTLVGGLRRGVPGPELADHIRRCIETVRLRALCTECNHDQLHYLCSELERDYGLATTSVDLDELSASGDLPAFEQADLLVTSSLHADEIRRVARRVGKPWIAIVLRKDFVGEVTRLLSQGPVYFVVADPRYAEKLRVIYGRVRGARNLRTLVVGRDDLDRIPEAAPTYITKAARERLPDETPLLSRTAPVERMFSRATAHEIFSFVVGANLAALRAQGSPRSPSGGHEPDALARRPASSA